MARKIKLSLRDVLSHLSYSQARKLLGPRGQALMREGGSLPIDIDAQVRMDQDHFALDLGRANVTLALSDAADGRIDFSCSECTVPCEHVGAAFSLILEEKLALGLAAAPRDTVPLEMLSDSELVERALADRAERARTERMSLAPLDGKGIWSDYTVTSGLSGQDLQGGAPRLGSRRILLFVSRLQDKHAGHLQASALCRTRGQEKAPPGKMPRPYKRTRITLHVRYGDEAELRLLLPDNLPREVEAVAAPLRDAPITDISDLMRRIKKLELLGHAVHIYPDAEEMTNAILTRARLDATVSSIRRDPRSHPLRKGLLKVELLPYQLDGIAFAVGAGRALLADDMGLGKTLQGIGTAELLARETGISHVLVVCPASVKAQWVLEIRRATDGRARSSRVPRGKGRRCTAREHSTPSRTMSRC